MKQIGIPKKESSGKNEMPEFILNNIFEIENVYTLLYLHPCYYFDVIDGLKIEEYDAFINGLKPLYCEFSSLVPKCELLDNMQLIATYRLLVMNDFNYFKNDLDSLFNKQKSFAELILDFYFYNVKLNHLSKKFKRSILLDIFEKSLKDLKALSESTLKKTNITVLNSLKALLTENIQGLTEKVKLS